MFVKPSSSMRIRTRMDAEAIREALQFLATAEKPEGMKGLLAHGYFLAGEVGESEFHARYHFNSHRNPQTYDVHGRVQESPDWRIIRLTLKAQAPWLSPIELVFVVIGVGLATWGHPRAPAVVLAFVLGVLGVYALANLIYIPGQVAARVAAQLAARVHGSVEQGGAWVVPEDAD